MAQKQKFKDKKKQQPAPPSKPVEKVVPKQEPVKQPEIPVAKQEPVKPVEKIQPKVEPIKQVIQPKIEEIQPFEKAPVIAEPVQKPVTQTTAVNVKKVDVIRIAPPKSMIPRPKRDPRPVYKAKDAMEWWSRLSEPWKKVFNKAVNANLVSYDKDTVEKMLKIQQLIVSYNKEIDNLDPLHKLADLEELWCGNTKIDSLEPLRDARKLKVLRCKRTNIDSLDALDQAISLEQLSCSIHEVGEYEVYTFQQKHPNCSIVD